MSERTAKQTRTITFDLEARAEGDQGIPVVISSDAVVEVRDGPEILVHTPQAVDLRRSPLPIIATHQPGQVNVGSVRDLLVSNGKLRGTAYFGSRPEAVGYRQDVLDGIITSLSAGYARIHASIRKDGVMVTDRWMPTHAAMIAEPADINAGFFRSGETMPEFQIEEAVQPAAETRADSQPAPVARGAIMSDATVVTTPAAPASEPQQTAVQMEQRRIKAIQNFCKANKLGSNIERGWIERNADWDIISDEYLALRSTQEDAVKNSAAFIDLSKTEVRQYSMWKALKALESGDWSDAGLELEATKAVAQKTGQQNKRNSFFVPVDVQHRDYQIQKRDAYVGGTAGYLVGTQNMSFIELLRNRMVLFQMGATRLSGLVGNVTIPKQTVGATAYWLSTESTAITEGNQTFAQLPLTPRTVGAYTEISRLLQLQSSPDAEALIMRDLAQQVAIAADLAGIAGTGTEQPTGITQTASIGTVSGTSFDYADILEFQSDVAAANALTGTCGYVTTPAIAALAMSRPTFTSGYTPIWSGSMLDGMMGGFKAMSSQQVPTAGMLFGDWSSVIVGEWGVLELAINPQANFPAGITGLRAMYTLDIGVRYAGAWSWGAAMT